MLHSIDTELDLASNLFGRLNPELRGRLRRVVDNPCHDTWDDAHGIVLNRHSWTTLWQAVLKVDPTFPSVGPVDGEKWPKVPSREVLVRALEYATH